jgi:hypothetical protein
MKNVTRDRSFILCRRLFSLAAVLLAVAGLAACSGQTDPGAGSSALAVGVSSAGIKLADASASFVQTGDTAWSLAKTGSVDTSAHTVTWIITATTGSTTSGHLIVDGYMAVTNTGTGTATIGNIVVNLQTKSGNSWVTQSSDIADATHGDAATAASIDPHGSSEGNSSFTENPASGKLKFMDANSNTMFSLMPQKTIAPGATVNLLYAAAFDNNVLGLADGTNIRAEIIVSFGNANPHGTSSPNVDINGNGAIDPDEAYVRSVPARITGSVPAQQPANSTPTITDTASDIVTTGTVTYSNASFNIGATSGTVTVTYDGGTDGGEITNCAHLAGTGSTTTVGNFTFPNVTGADLEACDTETIGAATCTPGAPGCGWKDGDMLTYDQTGWGDPGNPGAATLVADFGSVYSSTFGVVEVGIPGTAGFSMAFGGSSAVLAYLPQSGSPYALSSDLLDPTSSSSGRFGGDVLTLELNVDFSDAGFLGGTAGLKLGDLTLCGFSTPAGLNGTTVRQLLATVNTLLGGGSASYSIYDIGLVVDGVNTAFAAGAASTYAQTHLVNGACP